ncbi:patellin-3-like [Abeliophyllum distichum]|uniref:Patellin-3-like n=1 Tax=Abeliophyllum distichum TaxID=126358 RepID=A0ABD1QI92_9LAMI
MAEETKKPTTEGVVVSDVCMAKTPTTAIVEKEGLPQPEPKVEKVGKPVVEGKKEAMVVEDEKVAESAFFKEESNKVDDLIDLEKKALDEFKHLIQKALNKHEFTASPPPSPPAKEEEKKEKEEESKKG